MAKMKYDELFQLFLTSSEWGLDNEYYVFKGDHSNLKSDIGIIRITFHKDSGIAAFTVVFRYGLVFYAKAGFYRYWWNKIRKYDKWFNHQYDTNYSIYNIMKE